ncbi:MAG: sigma-70 family RNA polymerase sigma factor [Verrucomicrobia bacterium]|nr:sigma-70 family RNA polymerase sigma factor [Verrucomicrobiota bacterium]
MLDLLRHVWDYQKTDSLERRMQAAEALIIKVRPRLAAYVGGRVSVEDAKDVLQEAVIGIATNLHQFRGTTDEQVLAWCYQVAKYKLADLLRKKARHPESMDPDTLAQLVEATAAKQPMSLADRMDLEEAIRLLRTVDPPCYDIVYQRLWLELDWGTIGELHGKTEDAARMELRRCLQRARGLLGPARKA